MPALLASLGSFLLKYVDPSIIIGLLKAAARILMIVSIVFAFVSIFNIYYLTVTSIFNMIDGFISLFDSFLGGGGSGGGAGLDFMWCLVQSLGIDVVFNSFLVSLFSLLGIYFSFQLQLLLYRSSVMLIGYASRIYSS